MRQAYTFNAILMSAGCESKNVDFWRFQVVGGTFDPAHHNGSNAVEKHVDLKPV